MNRSLHLSLSTIVGTDHYVTPFIRNCKQQRRFGTIRFYRYLFVLFVLFVSITNVFINIRFQSWLHATNYEYAVMKRLVSISLETQKSMETKMMQLPQTNRNTPIITVTPQQNKNEVSLHSRIFTNSSSDNKNNVFYSLCRQDRPGSVITDMLYAHSYAYIHNLTYGGACCLSTKYPKIETIDLIQRLSLTNILPFQCPPDTNIGQHLQMSLQQVQYNTISFVTHETTTKKNRTKIITLPTTTTMSSQIYHHDVYNNPQLVPNHMSLQYRIYLQQLIRNEKERNGIMKHDLNNHRHYHSSSSNINKNNNNGNDHTTKLQYNIVVHIRRGDITPCHLKQRYLPNLYYLLIIEEAKQMIYKQHRKYNYHHKDDEPNIHVTIYSESDSYETFDIFYQHNYTVELDTDDLLSIWDDMSNADVVLLSRSFFSFVPLIVQQESFYNNSNNKQQQQQQIVIVPKFYGFHPIEGWYYVNDDFMKYIDHVTELLIINDNNITTTTTTSSHHKCDGNYKQMLLRKTKQQQQQQQTKENVKMNKKILKPI